MLHQSSKTIRTEGKSKSLCLGIVWDSASVCMRVSKSIDVGNEEGVHDEKVPD